MLDKDLLRRYYFAIEDIKKLFPAMAEHEWERHEETLALWYDHLVELDCNDWELTQVIGRIILHLFSCDCGTIPKPEEWYRESLETLDRIPEQHKEAVANSIAEELKSGREEWFKKFAGTKYLETYASMHHHLIAVRRGLPPTFCPFKKGNTAAS